MSPVQEFKKIKIENNLRLILVSQPASLAVTVMVLVQAGSKYETKEINGISHFLEHMCFKGTKNRPNQMIIASELDSLGAEYNAFTGRESTGYFAKARNDYFEKLIDVVSDIYLNSIFDEKEIDKERGPIIEEINMYEDLPTQKIQETFFNLVYDDQPAGWDIAGTKENIQQLKREDFLKYRQEHYLANSTVVVIAGNFDLNAAETKIRDIFKVLNTGRQSSKLPVKEEQTAPAQKIVYKELDQTHMILGFRAFDIFDDRRFALQVLADILGGGMSSRFFQKIRTELGAAYYVSASADFYTDHGLLMMNAGVDHRKVEETLKIALNEFVDLREKLVQPAELQRAKDHLIGNLFLSLERSDEIAAFYGGQEILTDQIFTPEEVASKIQQVTAEEVRGVAQAIIKPERLNLAMISPLRNKDFTHILKV